MIPAPPPILETIYSIFLLIVFIDAFRVNRYKQKNGIPLGEWNYWTKFALFCLALSPLILVFLFAFDDSGEHLSSFAHALKWLVIVLIPWWLYDFIRRCVKNYGYPY
jgi:hypothetical protein